MSTVLRALFFGLWASAVLPPFIPMAGPLSADDVFPLLAVGVALFAMMFGRRAPPFDIVLLGLLGVISVGWVSAAINTDTWGAFARTAGRGSGRLMFYLALVVSVRWMAQGGWVKRALSFMAGVATLEALFGVWAYFARYEGPYNIGVMPFSTWSVLAGNVRLQGTFGGQRLQHEAMAISPNFLAAYLVMSIVVTLGLVWVARPNQKTSDGGLHGSRAVMIGWLVAAALQGVALYLTFTRAGLMALALALVAFGFLVGRRRLAVVLLVVALGGAATSAKIRAKFLGEKHDRWSLYWASLRITKDHPVFGIGDGHYDRVLGQEQRYYDTPYGVATSTSHNSILLAAAHGGLLGGVAHAFLYLAVGASLLLAVRQARTREERGLAAAVAAAFVGYLAQDQVNNLAFVPKVATQMWGLVALAPVITPRRKIALVTDLESRGIEDA